MIIVTRLDKQQMYLNPDQIVSIEETPDTVITLFNGNHFIVKERAQIIISRIIAFRARVIRRAGSAAQKKYLSRPKQSQFRNINDNNACPSKDDGRFRTPFHPQDV
ncbi:MAG TPA: flagellar FlbD family protein [Desulfuromonadaceae bacterium]|jgi:flagellar protein FlbD